MYLQFGNEVGKFVNLEQPLHSNFSQSTKPSDKVVNPTQLLQINLRHLCKFNGNPVNFAHPVQSKYLQ